MNYESRKGHQAGKESAGMSSRPDPSKGTPQPEKHPALTPHPQPLGIPANLEVFRGFRLWRVVDGQLRSWTNDTVWPTGHALVAEPHVDWRRLGENFWGLAFWVGLVSSGIIAISLWTLLAQFFQRSYLRPTGTRPSTVGTDCHCRHDGWGRPDKRTGVNRRPNNAGNYRQAVRPDSGPRP